jgi:hypothetical protein
MDIYAKLAADILGKPPSAVTAEERARAKTAFWGAFRLVAQLPGNEKLASAGEAPRA